MGATRLQSNHENAKLGDVNAKWQTYSVKMKFLLENFNPFALCATDRIERIMRCVPDKAYLM